MRFWHWLPSALLALLLLGCGSGRQAEPEVGPSRDAGVALSVENGSSTSFRVFVVSQGNEVLVGRVEPLRTTALRLPSGVSGQIALMIRPNARARDIHHRSEPFTVSAGERVEWRLRGSAGG